MKQWKTPPEMVIDIKKTYKINMETDQGPDRP